MQNVKKDALLELKEDILKMKETGMNKLAQAIQKRKEVQQHLSLIIEAINVAGEEAKKVQDVNNFYLEEMVAAVSVSSFISQNDSANLISELMSLVQDSTIDDSVETFKQKIKKSAKKYEQQLVEATEIASEYELRQKTKIHFELLDDKDVPIPTLLDDHCSPLLLLSHHCLFSLLQKQKIPLKVVQQSTNEMKPTTTKLFTSPPAMNSDSFYLCRWRKFILRFYESGKLASEIHIRPAPTFHPQFVKELADFCLQSPMNFSNTIRKVYKLFINPNFDLKPIFIFLHQVMPGVFILIPMSHPQFQPAIHSMIKHGSTYHNCTAEDFDEVGITSVKNLAGKVIGWSFVFVLEDYEDFQNRADNLPKSVGNNEYFGDVIHQRGLETVSQLSKASKKSKQTNSFTFSLEYQFFF